MSTLTETANLTDSCIQVKSLSKGKNKQTSRIVRGRADFSSIKRPVQKKKYIRILCDMEARRWGYGI